jgi:hypothetical protein
MKIKIDNRKPQVGNSAQTTVSLYDMFYKSILDKPRNRREIVHAESVQGKMIATIE